VRHNFPEAMLRICPGYGMADGGGQAAEPRLGFAPVPDPFTGRRVMYHGPAFTGNPYLFHYGKCSTSSVLMSPKLNWMSIFFALMAGSAVFADTSAGPLAAAMT
jgi:hypothetical protein